jgi:sugar (pentulose or hexulose) kinase
MASGVRKAGPRHAAIIDIGKTNAKLALVDLETRSEIAIRKTPNSVITDAPYPHFDIERLWSFILDGLAGLNREMPVEAISVTTHGAAVALLDSTGKLAMPVLDYEHDGPASCALEYDAIRPPFSETGSPRLPIGLNLGAQLFWQQTAFPELFRKVTTILTLPQYWSFRLTGVAANEATSLGCHTDLWNPAKRDYSSLVDSQGWRPLMAPIRKATDRLGVVLPDIASRTGIAPSTPVHCGIHDSNASLLPHVLSRQPPFSVVSTGTWVIAMAIGRAIAGLDPSRDTLINVNALGDPVPSARFMGGREYEQLMQGTAADWTDEDIAAVLERRIFLLPSVQQGSGPFPSRMARWTGDNEISPGARHAAISFYLALMTATCLQLIGADGPTITEGPFARNALYARMLRAATGREVFADAGDATGTSIGAALLTTDARPALTAHDESVAHPGPPWTDYARAWNMALR